ncbi:hypothetical protein V9T40_003089 [Parthenolecanium corni]|uniref:Peptidase M3A/M3B catalytic domain-containing protein n=1 Tax=Parthenolecanium corni TaxID=536013 RepID=A0AAN9TQ07_9HEMI
MYFRYLKLRSPKCYYLHSLHYSSASESLFDIFNNKVMVKRGSMKGFLSIVEAKPLGYFNYPAFTTAENLIGMKYTAVFEKDKYYFECLDPNRNRKLVQVFDDLSDTICKVADLAEFLRTMDPDIDMMLEAREICIEMSNIVESLNTDKELYLRIKEVAENGDKFPMSAIEQHIVNLFLFDFELSGIHLPEAERKKVVHYNNCVLQSGQQFASNCAKPRVLDKQSVPPLLNQYFSTVEDGNLLVNGYSDIQDEFAREFAYKTFLSPNKTQETYLDDVLSCRSKLAELCGFPTYAHRAVKGSAAGTPEFVFEFLTALNEEFRDEVKADMNLIQKAKAADSDQELGMWDMAYYIAKIKQDHLKYDAKEFAPYFSVGACMEGLNNLAQKLFGITFKVEILSDAEAWDNEIFRLNVIHYKEGCLGQIYCDFFERPQKPNQDCHYTIKGGRRLADGSYQNPVVVIVLNFPRRTENMPSLLTPQMVENLFHEMGHGLHTMLGRAEYQHVTGTRCSTDFAEVPSVLMEYFASDPRVIRTFAKHYKTLEPMPEDLLQRLGQSKIVCNVSELQAQIFYSALDYTYHTDPTAPGRTTEILADIQSKYYPLPYVEHTAWQLRFSHLIGYGAKYYSYLMSRAIASSIWQMYFNADPFDRRMGEKYRRECLAFGGGKPARLLVEDFLKTKLTPAFLTEALVREVRKSRPNSR